MDNWEETQDDNIYADDARESQIDDGEISPEEEAFMQGYDAADEVNSPDKDEDDEDKEEEF